MRALLWVLQVLLGLLFLAMGVTHFIVPEGLPPQAEWMYDLGDTAHMVAGTAEILGGLGLILPGLTRIKPQLTVWAAIGLMVVMAGAVVYHVGRGEYQNVGFNALLALLLAFVAYGRTRKAPLTATG